jgi:hypothetical protein
MSTTVAAVLLGGLAVVVVWVTVASVSAARRLPYDESRHRADRGERSIYHQPGDSRPAGPDAETMYEERPEPE